MYKKPSFLDMPAPAGYVPGLGRGATGFTTRSDIGPARTDVAEQAFGGEGAKDEADDTAEDERFRDAENEEGLLFTTANPDAEDEEADAIYDKIDQRMQERRKRQREEREREEREEARRSDLGNQFAEFKSELSKVSWDEWDSLPEAGDMTRKNKRRRREARDELLTSAVPDSLIASRQSGGGGIDRSIDVQPEGATTDFRAISATKGLLLDSSLTRIKGTSDTTAPKVDVQGYLTSLESFDTSNFGDLQNAKSLFASYTKSLPRDPRGWIGLARVEAIDNQMGRAKAAIIKGCENCPKDEDVWLQSISLHTKSQAKSIVREALEYIPGSVKLWREAAALEDDTNSKVRVLEKAIQSNPASDTLWKDLINLHDDREEARALLSKAVELVPLAEDLWLSLARLEDAKNAKKVLNRARKALRVSRAVWIAAARLEEQSTGDAKVVEKLMKKGVQELKQQGGLPERSVWIEEAEKCEAEEATLTCHAIIKAAIGQGIEEEDQKTVWLEDGSTEVAKEKYETARAIYTHALDLYPSSNSLWLELIKLEKDHGTDEALWSVLERAIAECPTTEAFWIMLQKEKARAGDLDAARKVLSEAFKANPNSEKIWLAAAELETENDELVRASKLLARARSEAGTETVWAKSVLVERIRGNLEEALRLVEEGTQLHKSAAKLYIQKGQIYELKGDKQKAIEAYTAGTRQCREFVPLWTSLARMWIGENMEIKARSVLDQAALVNDKNETIWLERVRLEKWSGNSSQAATLLNRALKEVPSSGLLWSEYIWDTPRLQRKKVLIQAVKATDSDSYVICTGARHFWDIGKLQEAQSWFRKAIAKDNDNGDNWLHYYKYLLATKAPQEELDKVVKDFETASPSNGVFWSNFLMDVKNFNRSRTDLFVEAVKKL
ncbi:pre-mRNA-splicing factor 6 [Trichomonascus vanleenenianus]|uniref:U4/U6-U5 snRNP complex subunit PRP6 n=1 Tax=Trichomonascus vanleenenianus TaxID=2268995 RepID=UPI003ECB12FF